MYFTAICPVWSARAKRVSFLLFLIGAGVLYIIIYTDIVDNFMFEDYAELGLGSDTPLEDLGYLINTTGCKIRRTPIFPKYFQVKWHTERNPDCDYVELLTRLEEDAQIIRLVNRKAGAMTCCVHEITRKEKEDEGYNLSPCEKLTSSADVSQKEMLLTKCGTSLNFEFNFIVPPTVQAKMDFWNNQSKATLPPNIMLFGSDTLSRSQAYRSLPKTMEYLKELGFEDFKGYHSAGGTFSNYVGFLMGMRRVESMAHCAPEWSSPYDSCPFIWDEFSDMNYVTMYMEDGHQTFNWGGQGGFKNKPTDYYLHSLFSAIKDLRPKYSPFGHRAEHNIDCTSNETVPQFVVRTTKRFIRKFRSTPFFSFTWLEDPFHDTPYALENLDSDILDLFQTLASDPELLERTFIVFLSDHGDRFSVFRTKSSEGLIERGLPAFLMRVPKSIVQKLDETEVQRSVRSNAELLTAPTDLHHTLKHILNLYQNSGENKQEFNPALPDRTSLFVPADPARNCDTLRLDDCICNIFLGNESENGKPDPAIQLSKMVAFAEKQLNNIVSSSKYGSLCASWDASTSTIISTQILAKQENTTSYVMQFTGMAGYGKYGKFEARIKTWLGIETKFELIGEFERVDAYGTQSDCVQPVTRADKKMKELCMCK